MPPPAMQGAAKVFEKFASFIKEEEAASESESEPDLEGACLELGVDEDDLICSLATSALPTPPPCFPSLRLTACVHADEEVLWGGGGCGEGDDGWEVGCEEVGCEEVECEPCEEVECKKKNRPRPNSNVRNLMSIFLKIILLMPTECWLK